MSKKKNSLLSRLRNYFLAGIVVLVPIGFTLYLTIFLIKVSSKLLPSEINPNNYLPFSIPGLEILLSVIIIIILVSGIIGFYSLSLAKFKALAAIELVLNPDLDGQNQMLRSLMYFISGVLLLIPGLFSDLIGLILMFYATITKKSDSYKVEQKKADGTTIEGEYKNER